jgi:hypothetical protein
MEQPISVKFLIRIILPAVLLRPEQQHSSIWKLELGERLPGGQRLAYLNRGISEETGRDFGLFFCGILNRLYSPTAANGGKQQAGISMSKSFFKL